MTMTREAFAVLCLMRASADGIESVIARTLPMAMASFHVMLITFISYVSSRRAPRRLVDKTKGRLQCSLPYSTQLRADAPARHAITATGLASAGALVRIVVGAPDHLIVVAPANAPTQGRRVVIRS